MTRYFSTKSLVGFSILATLLLFAFSGSHPTTGGGGYTGAPNDNVCTTCHTPGGSLDGNITISGLPSSVDPNTTYPLTVTITNTVGSAVKAGFQMVSLKANLANGGIFTVPASESNALVKTINTAPNQKYYVGHQPAKNFTGNQVIYNVEWTSPASADGNITVYAASMIANGANGNSGDKFVATNVSTILGGSGDPLSATFSNIADASCSDSNDGSATINATGGSGNYSYEWDNGETNATAVMLAGGTHDVTVTDDSNAQITEMVTIDAPAALNTSTVFQNNAVCNGEMSGSAELTTTGGTPGYSYNWGNGIMGATQNNLAANNYMVTVTDLNNCTELTSVLIGQPTAIDIGVVAINEPTCHEGNDGMIIVQATGGNAGFTYNWLDGIGTPSGDTLSLIPAGDYQIEVVDIEGCTNQTTITVGEPEEVTSTVTGTDISCFGGLDGTVTAEGFGGNGGFTYMWSNGETGAALSGLAAGIYSVTVSDNEDCTHENSYELNEPAAAVESGISIITQPNCGNQDGELSAYGIGGTPGYTYLWNTNTTIAVLTNISSGIYTVTVTDMNDCTSEFTVTLEDNDGITLAANDVGNNTCFGGTEGTATISASGGSGMYSYLWSNGGNNPTENNLPTGQYSITVSDEGNCTGEIAIEITGPDDFETNEVLTHIDCNGAENGSIQLNATGGTGDLTYLWNTGDTVSTIVDLIPGIFSVTITDTNGCTGETEFVINEPDLIVTGTVESAGPTCPGEMDGFISLDPSGGTGELSFLWSNGSITTAATDLSAGDYSVTITDQNDCEVIYEFTIDDPTVLAISSNSIPPTCSDGDDGSATLSLIGGSGNYSIMWSTGDTTLMVENLAGGLYTVTVTDGNGCEAESEVVITAPAEIEPNISSTNETINGIGDGTATAEPLNGLAPYTFVWNNGDTTQLIENLSPGNYSVTITDANDCTAEESTLVNNGECNLTSNTEAVNISCFGLDDGSISLDLTGAVEPILYLWSNESTEPGLMNLGVGLYSVTITDANSCQHQITDIEITEPDEIIATDPVITDASNSSSTDGAIEIEFSGGTGTLSIEYTDENGTLLEIENLEDLKTGEYGMIVTDEDGCSKTFGPFVVGVISSLKDIDPIIAVIFPNPARSFFTIETDAKLVADPSIFAVSGQLINSTFKSGVGSFTFDTENLSNGVYYIKLVSETDIILKKIIIAK